MAQSLNKVYVHTIFSTKYREPTMVKAIKPKLYAYMGGICNTLECYPIQIGGIENHIHILCSLSKKITIIKFLEEIKKSSSKWMKTQAEMFGNFYWQNGYGIFSVNPSQIQVVKNYILNQEEHHRKKTFKTEYLAFLKKYNVDYNEKYL